MEQFLDRWLPWRLRKQLESERERSKDLTFSLDQVIAECERLDDLFIDAVKISIAEEVIEIFLDDPKITREVIYRLAERQASICPEMNSTIVRYTLGPINCSIEISALNRRYRKEEEDRCIDSLITFLYNELKKFGPQGKKIIRRHFPSRWSPKIGV